MVCTCAPHRLPRVGTEFSAPVVGVCFRPGPINRVCILASLFQVSDLVRPMHNLLEEAYVPPLNGTAAGIVLAALGLAKAQTYLTSRCSFHPLDDHGFL